MPIMSNYWCTRMPPDFPTGLFNAIESSLDALSRLDDNFLFQIGELGI